MTRLRDRAATFRHVSRVPLQRRRFLLVIWNFTRTFTVLVEFIEQPGVPLEIHGALCSSEPALSDP